MDVIVAGSGPAGLLTAARLDVAGAEVCERGSEPTRQSRGTAMHPRIWRCSPCSALATAAGSAACCWRTGDSMVRKAAGTGLPGCGPGLVGRVGDVQLAGPVEHARHHRHQEFGHANVVPPGGSAARIYGTHAAGTQLAVGQAGRQEEPFTLSGLSATLTGISGTRSGAQPVLAGPRTCNTGRRDAASLAWNRLPRGSAARTHSPATHSVTVIPAVN
jgi:hypothetical protein